MKKKSKYVKVQLMLDLDTINFLKQVASLAGTDQNTVVNVILAAELIKAERDSSDTTNKSTNKGRNGKSPKKSRVAKRGKSRRAGAKSSRNHV
jgi:hypothetical protein